MLEAPNTAEDFQSIMGRVTSMPKACAGGARVCARVCWGFFLVCAWYVCMECVWAVCVRVCVCVCVQARRWRHDRGGEGFTP